MNATENIGELEGKNITTEWNFGCRVKGDTFLLKELVLFKSHAISGCIAVCDIERWLKLVSICSSLSKVLQWKHVSSEITFFAQASKHGAQRNSIFNILTFTKTQMCAG